MERADWRDEAACLHADPDLFFPVGHGGAGTGWVAGRQRAHLDQFVVHHANPSS
jgi:hypothetical protein